MFLDGFRCGRIGALPDWKKKIMYPSDYPHERPTLKSSWLTFPAFAPEKICQTKLKRSFARQLHRFLFVKAFEVTRTDPSFSSPDQICGSVNSSFIFYTM